MSTIYVQLQVLVELIMTTGLLSYEVYNPKKKLSKGKSGDVAKFITHL